MICDGLALRGRAAGKQLAQPPRKLVYVALIILLAPQRRPLPRALAHIFVSQTLLLGSIESGPLNEQPLTFVSSTRPAEPDYDSRKRRMLAGAASERGIAAGQEHEVVEVGAGETESLLSLHAQQAPLR